MQCMRWSFEWRWHLKSVLRVMFVSAHLHAYQNNNIKLLLPKMLVAHCNRRRNEFWRHSHKWCTADTVILQLAYLIVARHSRIKPVFSVCNFTRTKVIRYRGCLFFPSLFRILHSKCINHFTVNLFGVFEFTCCQNQCLLFETLGVTRKLHLIACVNRNAVNVVYSV